MKDAIPPKTISELADQLDRIREELFSVQRSLEKMEPIEVAVESAVTRNTAESRPLRRGF
jgi:hypothetical protein